MNYIKKKFKISDIDRIFVNLGPGKFTSHIISLSVAKAICLANSADLIGFKSHDLIKSLGKIVQNSKDKSVVSDVSHLLLDQARIVEGEMPLDTKVFTEKLSSIITRSLSG